MNRALLVLIFSLFSLASFPAWNRAKIKDFNKQLNDQVSAVDSRVRIILVPEYIHQIRSSNSPFLPSAKVRRTKKLASLTVEVYSPNVDSYYRKVIEDILRPALVDSNITYDIMYTLLPAEPIKEKPAPPVVIKDKYAKDTFVFLTDVLYPFLKTFGYALVFFFVISLYFNLKGKKSSVVSSNWQEDTTEHASLSAQQVDEPRKVEKPQMPEVTDKDRLTAMSVDSLVALFTDCYWCEEDSYTKYLWDLLPSNMRAELLKKSSILHDYVQSVSSVKEQNLFLLTDTYYLNPLQVSHLSNKDLAQLMAKDRKLLNQVSLLRKKTILMQYGDAIRTAVAPTLQEAGKDEDRGLNLLGVPGSLKRQLGMQYKFFATVAEEEQFFHGSPNPSLSRDNLSLGWSRILSDEQLTEVLSFFTVNDLAAAWVGPKQDLERLASLLDKNSQTKLYKTIDLFEPSRQVSTYLHLCREITKRLLVNNPAKVAV